MTRLTAMPTSRSHTIVRTKVSIMRSMSIHPRNLRVRRSQIRATARGKVGEGVDEPEVEPEIVWELLEEREHDQQDAVV